MTRQVAKCKCPKRFQVEQIGANKYRVSTLLAQTLLIVVFITDKHYVNCLKKNKTKLWCHVRNRLEGRFVSVAARWNASTLTFCAFIVLYMTSSTLETRYIWKFYSVYNLFCFVAYKSFYHYTALAVLLTLSVQTSGCWNSEAEMIRCEKSGKKNITFHFLLRISLSI